MGEHRVHYIKDLTIKVLKLLIVKHSSQEMLGFHMKRITTWSKKHENKADISKHTQGGKLNLTSNHRDSVKSYLKLNIET